GRGTEGGQEETGCTGLTLNFPGAIAYETGSGTKIVRFWNMTISGGQQTELDKSEVAKAVWLSPDQAMQRLSYPLESLGNRRDASDVDQFREAPFRISGSQRFAKVAMTGA